jgi:hypothetical protein
MVLSLSLMGVDWRALAPRIFYPRDVCAAQLGEARQEPVMTVS